MKKEMIKLSGMECYGGNGDFVGDVHIASEKYDALPTEIKNKISHEAAIFLGAVRHMIEMEWTREFEKVKRQEHIAKMSQLFVDAGFEIIYVKVIDNQYSNDACYYTDPWLVVTTKKGPITLGWRKRVINIDWSESDIIADGRELFKDEHTTKDKQYVHCWGEDKAVEYLQKLLES